MIFKHRHYPRLVTWIKLITVTGGAQTVVQAIGLVSGILIIRLMPVKEYAWYTIANTMLGTLTILSDGGISTGVMAEGGKVWHNKKDLGIVLVTGMQLRRQFALISLIVSLPILIYLLNRQQADLFTSLLIALCIIPAFYASLSDSLLEIPLKLHQNIADLQKNQVLTAIARFVLIFSSLFFYPLAFFALIGNGLPRIWANFQLKKYALNYVNFSEEASTLVKSSILKLVRKLLPGAIYYSFSGQITIWVLSIFGNSKSVAEIGALGRISMFFSLFTILFSTLIAPRFARIKESKSRIQNKFYLIQVVFIVLFIFLTFLSFIFSKQILFILGSDYSQLNHELVLSILANCVSLLAGFTYSLYTSRGWAIQPYIYVPINIFAITIGAFVFRINSLFGVIELSIFTASVQYIMNIIFCEYCFRKYLVNETVL